MHKFVIASFFALMMPCMASSKLLWGDQGDGTFINPALNADYSDPDVIRVGDKYYLTCSEFHYMGMLILESDDLVNWHIISRVFDTLPGYDEVNRYAEGTWAPALRYHEGTYYIYVCSPHDGLWVTTAKDPAGPWTPMLLIHEADRWEDPCPFWDEDGNAYLGRSQWGAGPIYVHRMSPDGMRLLDDGVKVYEGPVAEGTKFYAKDGYIYLSIPEGGVGGGWQTVLRSKDIYGPYEGGRVLEQGSTDINGPHQGALVDTPQGDWWFVHFQETPVLGRVMHLQPVDWSGDFPRIGEDYDGNGIGEPMRHVVYAAETNTKGSQPQTDDDFTCDSIGVQWQYNHNPEKSKFDLNTRKGWLSWIALGADSIKNARNTLTQKIMGYSGNAETRLDFTEMGEGQRAGIHSIGKYNYGVGVTICGGKPYIYVEAAGNVVDTIPLGSETSEVTLVYSYDITDNSHRFFWRSEATDALIPIGPENLRQRWGNWKGIRTGLYNYTTDKAGIASFDHFTLRITK